METRGASAAYGARNVVSGLDLAFERGVVHAVIGPTGCGKTTLLHLLAGLVAPRAGSVVFRRPEDARRVALIPQDYGLFPWKTVRQNALMGLEIRRLPRKERPAAIARCEGILSELRIDELAERWPSTLSGGQKQRVAVARALAVEPALLLMDEPFSALDADIREELQDLLVSLPGRFGATPVIVTHDIAEALRVAGRIVLFRPEAPSPEEGRAGAFTAEMIDNDGGAETATALRNALRGARANALTLSGTGQLRPRSDTTASFPSEDSDA